MIKLFRILTAVTAMSACPVGMPVLCAKSEFSASQATVKVTAGALNGVLSFRPVNDIPKHIPISIVFTNRGDRDCIVVRASWYTKFKVHLWQDDGKEVMPTENGASLLTDGSYMRFYLEKINPGKSADWKGDLADLFDLSFDKKYRCEIAATLYTEYPGQPVTLAFPPFEFVVRPDP